MRKCQCQDGWVQFTKEWDGRSYSYVKPCKCRAGKKLVKGHTAYWKARDVVRKRMAIISEL